MGELVKKYCAAKFGRLAQLLAPPIDRRSSSNVCCASGRPIAPCVRFQPAWSTADYVTICKNSAFGGLARVLPR